MDAQLIKEFHEFFKTVDTSQFGGIAAENQRIINELARVGLKALQAGQTTRTEEAIEKEVEVKHSDVAKEFGVSTKTIRNACKDGRIQRFRETSSGRITFIPKSEVDRVRHLFKRE